MKSMHVLAERLEQLLRLTVAPVALAFADEPPAGVSRIAARAPAGCAYWSRAAQGEVFYTLPDDHRGCAVGAYTHGASFDAAQQAELEQMIGTMTGLEYLSMSEVPGIPRRAQALGVVTYAPLARCPVTPDVVLMRGPAASGMLFAEAAHAAGIRDATFGGLRPACAVVPQVTLTIRAATSFGCVGNRVYTGLADTEMWFAAPFGPLEALLGKLDVVARANRELETFHRGRVSAGA
jgi:uncharacterized protein (DUF169 family)